MSGNERQEIVRAAYRQIFERDIAKGYSQAPCSSEASQLVQGKISMREFIRALGRCKEYRQQFHDRFVNSRVVELAYRHFLGRGSGGKPVPPRGCSRSGRGIVGGIPCSVRVHE